VDTVAEQPITPPAGTLFDKHRGEPAAPPRPPVTHEPATSEVAAPNWLDDLFSTPDFAAQRRLLARAYSGDELFKQLLSQLDARGGRMTKPALARALAYPPFRMAGLLTQAQRLFNVDGYPVITVDVESDTVSFERRTLLVQFGISDTGSDQS
jgi:hypothetical protein